MTNRDRSARWLRVVQRSRAGSEDTTIAELRYELLDRIVQSEAAFLKEQQRGAGRDQLGVGVSVSGTLILRRRAGYHMKPGRK